MFDELITYRSAELDRLWTRLRECEQRLGERPDPAAARIVAEARATLTAVPVDEAKSRDPVFTASLRRVPRGFTVAPHQAALEQEWQVFARTRAVETARLLGRACPAEPLAGHGEARP
jgi:hypothetical protein